MIIFGKLKVWFLHRMRWKHSDADRGLQTFIYRSPSMGGGHILLRHESISKKEHSRILTLTSHIGSALS
jgi:hypothetical protein